MRPQECWPTVPLGTLAEFRNGVNYNKSNFGTGIKVIGVSDFQDHVRASFDQLEEINPEGVVRKEHLLRDGDILFVRSNGNRELIGRSLFVDGLHEDVTHSAFSIRLRFASPKCCPRFYAYLFRSTLIRQALSMYGGGTNISNLNQGILERLEVPMPPMLTQERIASILSTYDDLIENNSRRIKILEVMAKMLYREWFVNFRFPGHQKVKMVESELGPIPKGWKVEPLPHMCSKVIDGTHDSPPPVEGGFFLVTGKHFTSGFIDFDRCYRISADEHEKVMKRSKPEAGDILFSNIGTLGSIALVPNHPEFSIKNVALFKPRSAAHSTFMFCHFRLPESLKVLHQKASGTSQKFWSLQFLRNLPLLTPPENVIVLFHNAVAPLLSYRLLLNEKNRNLRTTRDLLLPKLISGEIPVEAAAEAMEQTA